MFSENGEVNSEFCQSRREKAIPYKCPPCNASFEDIEQFRYHIKSSQHELSARSVPPSREANNEYYQERQSKNPIGQSESSTNEFGRMSHQARKPESFHHESRAWDNDNRMGLVQPLNQNNPSTQINDFMGSYDKQRNYVEPLQGRDNRDGQFPRQTMQQLNDSQWNCPKCKQNFCVKSEYLRHIQSNECNSNNRGTAFNMGPYRGGNYEENPFEEGKRDFQLPPQRNQATKEKNWVCAPCQCEFQEKSDFTYHLQSVEHKNFSQRQTLGMQPNFANQPQEPFQRPLSTVEDFNWETIQRSRSRVPLKRTQSPVNDIDWNSIQRSSSRVPSRRPSSPVSDFDTSYYQRSNPQGPGQRQPYDTYSTSNREYLHMCDKCNSTFFERKSFYRHLVSPEHHRQ